MVTQPGHRTRARLAPVGGCTVPRLISGGTEVVVVVLVVLVVNGGGYSRGTEVVAPWQAVVVVVLVTAGQGSGSDLHVLLQCARHFCHYI